MSLNQAGIDKFTGPYPSREEVTRHRLLDACVLGVVEHGLRKFRMNHVIANSGLSRPSVYKYYKNKESVLVDAFTREVVRLSAELAATMEKHDSLEDKMVYGLLFAYEVIPQNPMIKLIIEDNSEISKFINADTQDPGFLIELGFSGVIEAFPKLKNDIEEVWRYWQRALLPLFLVPGKELETKKGREKYIRTRIIPGFGLEKYAARQPGKGKPK